MKKSIDHSFNIIISHVYSKHNKGDAALLSVLIKNIQKEFKRASITILTLDSISKGEKFEGVKVQNSFMFYAMKSFNNKALILFYSHFVMVLTMLWAGVYRFTGFSLPIDRKLRALCLLYAKADLILPVGGGYLRSHKKGVGSLLNISLLLHPIMLSYVLKRPTILYTQSIGPLNGGLEEILVKYVLNRTAAVIAREDTSLQLLKRIGVHRNIYRSIDSGFAFSAQGNFYNLHKILGIKKEKLIVGITARKWLSGFAQAKYECALAETVKHIVTNYNAAVVFIPQVTAEFHGDDDRIVHKRILSQITKLHDTYLIDEKINHYQIKAAYNSLDFLIGTRFHSVIFSLTSYVPAIAIEYEHKTSGIMKDLNLSKWVIKIEDVSGDILIDRFNNLIKNKKQYLSTLNANLPGYIKKTETARILIKEIYEKITKYSRN